MKKFLPESRGVLMSFNSILCCISLTGIYAITDNLAKQYNDDYGKISYEFLYIIMGITSAYEVIVILYIILDSLYKCGEWFI